MSDHDTGHLEGDTDDPVASSTWYIGVIGIFLFVATVAATDALYRVLESREQDRVINDPATAGRTEKAVSQAEQMARLLHTGTMNIPGLPGDPVLQTNTMPIGQAMQQIVKENGK